jgi:hypothetical protein
MQETNEWAKGQVGGPRGQMDGAEDKEVDHGDKRMGQGDKEVDHGDKWMGQRTKKWTTGTNGWAKGTNAKDRVRGQMYRSRR